MKLNEEQQMLQEYATRLLSELGPVANLRELRRTDTDYDQPLWEAISEAGWGGVLIDEEHGGLNFGHVGAGLIAHAIGQNLSVTPFLSTTVMAAQAFSQGGTTAQKEFWLPKIAAGKTVVALAIDEGHKHQAEVYHTRAEKIDGCWFITGEKTFVINGSSADALLVAAQVDNQAQLFLVDSAEENITVDNQLMVDSHKTSRIQFARTAAEPFTNGQQALHAALLSGRAILAAELAGLTESAFEQTLSYLKERKQFGVHIGSFQALQHRAAHLYAEIAMANALAFKALQAIDDNAENAETLVFASKAKANQVARLGTQEALQMHGGIGMTDEFNIGFYMKRARAAIEALGDTNYCLQQFARLQQY